MPKQRDTKELAQNLKLDPTWKVNMVNDILDAVWHTRPAPKWQDKSKLDDDFYSY